MEHIKHISKVSIGIAGLCLLVIGFIFYGIHYEKFLNSKQAKTIGSVEVKNKIAANFLKMPLSFESNNGQANNQVKFFTRGHGYSLFFTSNELVFTLQKNSDSKASLISKPQKLQKPNEHQDIVTEVLRAQFVGANQNPIITGADKQQSISNYFIGNDPKKWRTNVPNYSKVNYKNLYPGTEVVFYGNQQRLEYDIHVAPNADPKAFRLSFQGAKSLNINNQGDLVLSVASGNSVSMHKPVIYQETSPGVKKEIDGGFVLLADNQVGFSIPNYDKNKPLIIDPILYYSSYLGKTFYSVDTAKIALFTDNITKKTYAYVVGSTNASDFPVRNAYQSSFSGISSAIVTKLDFEDQSLIYSTYLNGAHRSSDTQAYGVAIDADGSAYVTGTTSSKDFPTYHAYQTANAGGVDAFVTKFSPNPTGPSDALSYSTYLGGDDSDYGYSIAVDSSGSAYVTGTTSSKNFPTYHGYQTANAGGVDVFVTKFNPNPTGPSDALSYSTYLGGGNTDRGLGIALDSSGSAYVTGVTLSTNFPTHNAYQAANAGDDDAFVTKFNPKPTGPSDALSFSTYLGGSSDEMANGVAVDSSGSAYVTGVTYSTDFPTHNAYQTAHAGNPGSDNACADAFVTEFNPKPTGPSDALSYSTYLGGSDYDVGNDIAVDSSGSAYVTGVTRSTNFPTHNAYQAANAGNDDAFVTEFNPKPTGPSDALSYSTYLGGVDYDEGFGIAVDSLGSAYIVGIVFSNNFPVTTNVFNNVKSRSVNNPDIFVARFSDTPKFSWVKRQITYPTLPDVRDIFDLVVTKETTTNCKSGYCLWATAPYENDQLKERTYRIDADTIYNVSSPTWTQCSLEGAPSFPTARAAGLFGIDKFEITANNYANGNIAYIPTDYDVQNMESSPGICSTDVVANTAPNDTTGFIQISADNAYVIKNNATNDVLLVSTNFSNTSPTWTTVTPASDSTLKISAIDGDSNAGNLFISTNRGLYSCISYPKCTDASWKKVNSISNLTKVLYRYTPEIPAGSIYGNASIPARSLLITTDTDGIYVSIDNGGTWTSKITPPPPIDGVITGIAADANYFYVSSYSPAPGTHARSSKAAMLEKYSVKNLIADNCSGVTSQHLVRDINLTGTGGISIGKFYARGSDSSNGEVVWLSTPDNVNYYDFGIYGFSKAVLGVSLRIDPNTGKANYIYVPSLGPTCNSGGVSIGTLSDVESSQSKKHK